VSTTAEMQQRSRRPPRTRTSSSWPRPWRLPARGARPGKAVAPERRRSGPTLALSANPTFWRRSRRRAGRHTCPFPRGLRRRVGGRRPGGAGRARGGQAGEKGCEAIVANDISQPGIGFGADENAVTVIFADGSRPSWPRRVEDGDRRTVCGRCSCPGWPHGPRRGRPTPTARSRSKLSRLPPDTRATPSSPPTQPHTLRRAMPESRLKTYTPQASIHLGKAGPCWPNGRPRRPGARQRAALAGTDEVDFHARWAPSGSGAPPPASRATRASPGTAARPGRRRGAGQALRSRGADSGAATRRPTTARCCWSRTAPSARWRLSDGRRQALVDAAARVLAGLLGALHDLSGREFKDPGFLGRPCSSTRAPSRIGACWRRAQVRRARLSDETAARLRSRSRPRQRPVRFSSTTGQHGCCRHRAEGATPFVGAWLRERVAPLARHVRGAQAGGNTWNAAPPGPRSGVRRFDRPGLHAGLQPRSWKSSNGADTDRDGALAATDVFKTRDVDDLLLRAPPSTRWFRREVTGESG